MQHLGVQYTARVFLTWRVRGPSPCLSHTFPIQACIDHQNVSPLCRLCKEKVESVTHIVSSYSVTVCSETNKEKGMATLIKTFTGSCARYLT